MIHTRSALRRAGESADSSERTASAGRCSREAREEQLVGPAVAFVLERLALEALDARTWRRSWPASVASWAARVSGRFSGTMPIGAELLDDLLGGCFGGDRWWCRCGPRGASGAS